MPAKVEYKLLSMDKLSHLEEVVNKYLEDGWELQGGVAATSETAGKPEQFVQAMTKKKKGKAGGWGGSESEQFAERMEKGPARPEN